MLTIECSRAGLVVRSRGVVGSGVERGLWEKKVGNGSVLRGGGGGKWDVENAYDR